MLFSTSLPDFRHARRLRLLGASSSLVVMLGLVSQPVLAQSVSALRAAAGISAPVVIPSAVPTTVVPANAVGFNSASVRALQYQAQVQNTVNLSAQAQEAARTAARAVAQSVPNGLVAGGLRPVANPVAAALDPTGLNTWQGADLPTASGNTVTIKQNETRAVLSWESFNVGRDTTLNFVQKKDWIVLNRVVNSIAPSQILGNINADGTVLVLNQNGILFGGTSQVNTRSLIASSLDIGSALKIGTESPLVPSTIKDRNTSFLQNGLLGNSDGTGYFSALAVRGIDTVVGGVATPTYNNSTSVAGAVRVEAGARVENKDGGFIILLSPKVSNAGTLTAPDGQVSLQAGRNVQLTPATGADDSPNRNIRGLVVTSTAGISGLIAPPSEEGSFVVNESNALISAARGYVSLGAVNATTATSADGAFGSLSFDGAVINAGILQSKTSVSRNGAVVLDAPNIQIGSGSIIDIAPDAGKETIPQGPESVAAFKPSYISIGDNFQSNALGPRIEMASNALINAPGGTVVIGPNSSTARSNQARIFIDDGAVINVGGVKDVVVPASRNSIQISPVKRNELRDTGTLRDGPLNGVTVFVDPRLSGVRSDGVAWVGSPLIEAASYFGQVGVTASELLTRGGNVTLGVGVFAQGSNISQLSDIIVKPGATIDISGGSVKYEGGLVKTTRLIAANGQIIDIGNADLNETYVGVVNNYTEEQPRFGLSQTFANPIVSGDRLETEYSEGRDAGSLSISASSLVFDANLNAGAFAGVRQLATAVVGTRTEASDKASSRARVADDKRRLQQVSTQLPNGGFLNIKAGRRVSDALNTGGGNIVITSNVPTAGALAYGQSAVINSNGTATALDDSLAPTAARTGDSRAQNGRVETMILDQSRLNDAGLGQFSLVGTGSLTVAADADLRLTPGGIFLAKSDRNMNVLGAITAPGGSISLETRAERLANSFLVEQNVGSVFTTDDDHKVFYDDPAMATSLSDIVIDGKLSVAGRWVNDLNADGVFSGNSFTNGGSIDLKVASSLAARIRVGVTPDEGNVPAKDVYAKATVDVSGSLLVNGQIDVSGGGYVRTNGVVETTARGGNLSLVNETNFALLTGARIEASGTLKISAPYAVDYEKFVNTKSELVGSAALAFDYPSELRSRVAIADGSIKAHGFNGGGTFKLTTPDLNLSGNVSESGTFVAPTFFADSGFGRYDISVYKTAFTPNVFANNRGGTNTFLATEQVRISGANALNLTQSTFTQLLSETDLASLQSLDTGKSIYDSTLRPFVPVNAWDQKPVALNLGGLIELRVDASGRIDGSAGSSLSVAKLWNEGTIRLIGGSITQSEVLPKPYAPNFVDPVMYNPLALGIRPINGDIRNGFSQLFGGDRINSQYSESALNKLGLLREIDTDGVPQIATNAELATNLGSQGGTIKTLLGYTPIYLLGDLDATEGVRLSAGSVTDLSGGIVLNPRAPSRAVGDTTPIRDGRIFNGGTLRLENGVVESGKLGATTLPTIGFTAVRPGRELRAAPGATINLSGVADAFDRLQVTGGYQRAPVWSNGGTLALGGGGSVAGANILASGGSSQALGGTLSWLNPILAATDPTTAQNNVISTSAIERAGFDTFVAQQSLTSLGDSVSLKLDRAFLLTGLAGDGFVDQFDVPQLGAQGALTIEASYIGLRGTQQSLIQRLLPSSATNAAEHSLTLRSSGGLDVTGAVLLDRSIGNATFDVAGDMRLIGVADPLAKANTEPSLRGQLIANGNLTLRAAQLYATTGTGYKAGTSSNEPQIADPFLIGSTSAKGTITFERSTATNPALPYSAGSALQIQAANILQGGIIRAPLGQITLGSSQANAGMGLPATSSLTLLSGSITSVSADGIRIPYGTTTDLTEYFFSPTSDQRLKSLPVAQLTLAGGTVGIDSGAQVNISGGNADTYAYEFVSGTGGSRDVLDRLNPDQFSSNNGLQFPDGRQVYAIVPSLKDVPAALFDPIYSDGYDALYDASAVGRRVYLNAGAGLDAGWYTLLPAKYALLPGGFRVVENVGATVTAGSDLSGLRDGSQIITGYYGTAGSRGGLESAIRDSTPRSFTVQSQSVFRQYSRIELTSATKTFTELAKRDGVPIPRLPNDAARLVINPQTGLRIDAPILSTPLGEGRGSQIDIGGQNINIVGILPTTLPKDIVVVTAASLTNLNAESLLIGGTRTDKRDGTTTLTPTAKSIVVSNSSTTPLTSPEILLAVDGAGSTIELKDGAVISAGSKPFLDQRTGNYIVTGGNVLTAEGALVRVANGPERLIARVTPQPVPDASLIVGAAQLSGNSVLLDSSGKLDIDVNIGVTAKNLALGPGRVAVIFAPTKKLFSGLVITPELQATLSSIERLTLRTSTAIAFGPGSYSFNDLALDTPGLRLLEGSSVTLQANKLELSNSSAAGVDCTARFVFACGTGTLNLLSTSTIFGSGTIHTYGFGSQVNLTASEGVIYRGISELDVGPAGLAITTPYLVDQKSTFNKSDDKPLLPSLTLTAGRDISITDPGGDNTASKIDGQPGSELILSSASLALDGARLRATAGKVDIVTTGDINLLRNAVVETPGYLKIFEDALDASQSIRVSAPGGWLRLLSRSGNIALSSGSLLNIGGAQGAAGSLFLQASNGDKDINLAGTINAAAPDGKASFTFESGGGFNLVDFVTRYGTQFTGDIAIRSGKGNLELGATQLITANNVRLTADGGAVDLAGDINVSGINGGKVGLFGAGGVRLQSGVLIDAHADGYAATDSRQARGGIVEIGVDGDAAINIDSGARIDVAARRRGDRLVALERKDPITFNNKTYYSFVQGDEGGKVLLRAPLIEQAGDDKVNINYSGQIVGARDISIEAFKRFDLANIARDARFTGVTLNAATNVATLDVGATAAGKVNFLGGSGAGTVSDFVQNLNIGGGYATLNGLNTQSNFVARPGIELVHSGDILLNSNWNLGAGTVDIDGAVAAGLMRESYFSTQTNKLYEVVPGKEGDIFSRFTSLTYRVGGKVDGAPGALSFRAGGNLTINGSITDGFFNFADQTNPEYLGYAFGGGKREYDPFFLSTCDFVATGTGCADVSAWYKDDSLRKPLNGNEIVLRLDKLVPFVAQNDTGQYLATANDLSKLAPYSVAANSPAAVGEALRFGGTGDPIGSAALFPLIDLKGSSAKAVESWSYRFVAGAAVDSGGAVQSSADPLHGTSGTGKFFTVSGERSYRLGATPLKDNWSNTNVGIRLAGPSLPEDPTQLTPADGDIFDNWVLKLSEAISTESINPETAYTRLDFDSAPAALRAFIRARAASFFAPDEFQFISPGPRTAPNYVTSSLSRMAAFLKSIYGDLNAGIRNGTLGFSDPTVVNTTAALRPLVYVDSLVRTGTGSIDVVASGGIDLRKGAKPEFRNQFNGTVGPAEKSGSQVGGTAIYTAGHIANMSRISVAATGDMPAADLDISRNADTKNYVATAERNYTQLGAFLANPVHGTGGGDISLVTSGDVLSRRDVLQEARSVGANVSFGYRGSEDMPWRVGIAGSNPKQTGIGLQETNIRINPQMFSEGFGALGGGNVAVKAGGTVSDVTFVSATSIATADVTGDGISTKALWTVGGGNVLVQAGGDLVGGRIDIGSGRADLRVSGDVNAAGQYRSPSDSSTILTNDLRLRLTDATVAVTSGRQLRVGEITAFAPTRGAVEQNGFSTRNALAFYTNAASVSLQATGEINLAPFDPVNNILPGSFAARALTGDIGAIGETTKIFTLVPSTIGNLDFLAARNIGTSKARFTLQVEDGNPALLPGIFSAYGSPDGTSTLNPGTRDFASASVKSTDSDGDRRLLHNETPTHRSDFSPSRIFAGGDITNVELSTPEQTRVYAGNDIIDMSFVGQNLRATDVTRVAAARDITATSLIRRSDSGTKVITLENRFIIGGPGTAIIESGRDLGPFDNSFVKGNETFAGGILSVGNDLNPWLKPEGANLFVNFGIAKGARYDDLRDVYLDPANASKLDGDLFVQVKDQFGASQPDRTKPIYAAILIDWMQKNAGSPAGTSYAEAYAAFKALDPFQQRIFLVENVYFNELEQTSVNTGPSYLQYSRGYKAVNTLFPAALGYTANKLDGGDAGASELVPTGNLDLRLATIQTTRGGNVNILGPGGRLVAGSVVRTDVQAARRGNLSTDGSGGVTNIDRIPIGFEGILTLRNGAIRSFTDSDLLLNQSRLFTQRGGNITLWSSNGDLNAGQGPKTAANFPPVVLKFDPNGFAEVDVASSVSGAGIAAFQPSVDIKAPDVFLIAPRGTVDAGDAGVRVAGNLFVAAARVANADNFKVTGTTVGVPSSTAVDVGSQASTDAATSALAGALNALNPAAQRTPLSRITVDVQGYEGGEDECAADNAQRPGSCPPVTQ